MTRFPLAWCSDDATWINFAVARGIRTISGPHVLWRRSGLNITSLKGVTIPAKLEAAAMFTDGLTARFSDADFADSKVPRPLFEEAQRDWFFGQLQSMAPLPRSAGPEALRVDFRPRADLRLPLRRRPLPASRSR
jgi:hypothetical protein